MKTSEEIALLTSLFPPRSAAGSPRALIGELRAELAELREEVGMKREEAALLAGQLEDRAARLDATRREMVKLKGRLCEVGGWEGQWVGGAGAQGAMLQCGSEAQGLAVRGGRVGRVSGWVGQPPELQRGGQAQGLAVRGGWVA